MRKITTILFMLLSVALFGQVDCDVTNPSNGFQGAEQCSATGGFNSTVANDIIIPADHNMTITAIMPSIAMGSGVTVTSAIIKIYNDGSGRPVGTPLTSQTVTPTSHTYQGNGLGMNFSDVLFDLTPIDLAGSAGADFRYWISLQVATSNNSTAYMETTRGSAVGAPIAYSDGGGFIIIDQAKDGVYTFFADCQPMTSGEFPFPYCGPLVFGTVEPITLVKVAGIDNPSGASVNGTPGHEDYTHITGTMKQGETYPITLKGNTVGEYFHGFAVFIDWNQNDMLDDAGEVYEIEDRLFGSTGTDDQQIIADIVVPADAKIGTTRMRVKKTLNGPFNNPCSAQANWGQVEDYSIEVTEGSGVSVSENALTGFSYYPNPSSGQVHLESVKNIESVTFYNLVGQIVFTSKVGTVSSSIDVSQLSAGTYIMKVSANDEIGTYKFMKK